MTGILYLQSSYSMLSNMIPIEELFLQCKNYGYKFIALTDNKLHGLKELYDLSAKYDLRPILGLEVELNTIDNEVFLLYVKNQNGYENLLKISSLKEIDNKLELEDLIAHQSGLSIIYVGKNINKRIMNIYNSDEQLSNLKHLNSVFLDFYVGLSFNEQNYKTTSSNDFYEYCLSNDIKIIPVHKSSYLKDEDKEVLDTIIKIANDNNELNNDSNYKLLTIEEMNNIYRHYPNAIDNLNIFLNSIKFNLELPKFDLPIYLNDSGVNSKDYLISLAKVGLKRRLAISKVSNDIQYMKRLDHELDLICRMNFENYFLIVYDFIKYAKDNKILVGPGRGSAAGSLVAYCLGITNVDPIEYGLMFERFLNPARMSMPDIDIDFPDNKREQVINYVKEKYGKNHIASITTFSKLGLRSSIRDVARVLKLAPSRANGIIESILSNNIDKSDLEAVKVATIASKLDGLFRQTGTHAAGIVLSKQDLTKYLPIQTGSYDFNQIQFDANTLEDLGLNKIDFLGIRNLTIIDNIIVELSKLGIKIDVNNINLSDGKTFELLSRADTTGIFQLESDGMRNVLQKLKPTNFLDIVATLALYRPGPMENIDIYIARKKGERFEYLHKDLTEILKPTLGIIIYQEQIMQIAQKFAGYDLFDADMLRVGVSKKNKVILDNERIKFVSGGIKQGYTKELSNQIYDYIVRFADYGFNKSHSVSYGLVSYQMAYLKANYYNIFMKVLLSSIIGNESQTASYIKESINNGLEILPPNLKLSTKTYELSGNSLVIPLSAIKGFGTKIVNEIIAERNKSEFLNYNDIKQRLSSILNDVQFKNLIYSGALDYLNLNRQTLVINSDLSSVGYEQFIKDYQMKEVEDYPFKDNSEYEKSAIGVNIKYDLQTLIKSNNPDNNKYKMVSEININNREVYVIGFIANIKEYINKNGELMYFISLTDGLNDLDVTVFKDEINLYKDSFNETLSIFLLRKNNYNNRVSYILSNIHNLNK